ncbi:MAG: SRPBCC family protein [Acidimicrobiales bacterium]
MPPIEVEISVDIDAPPEAVWPYLVDWERLGRWMKEASHLRVTSAQRERVGTEVEARICIGGIGTVDPIRVIRWEPPEVLEIEHLGWVKGTGIMRCTRRGEGTRLTWKETLVPPWGPIGALGMRLWQPMMRWTFRRDLSLLKSLVEEEAGREPRDRPGGSR